MAITFEKLDVFEKNACLPPARSSVRAVEGRQWTRYDCFETEAFIKVRRTYTYIYMNICMVMIVSHLTLGSPCGYDLWPTDPKNSGVLLLNRGYYPFYFQGSGSSGTQVIGDLRFYFSGPCALDLSPTDPKINMSPLLNKDIHYMNFEGSGWKRTPVIEWNVFTYGVTVTLTFDLLTPKSIEFL